MSKWVILSSDCNPVYSFLLPITAKAWQNLGFKPLLMLLGSEYEWESKCPKVLQELKAIGDKLITFIPCLNGYSMWTTANIVRLFPGCMKLPNDDYAIVGDADLWVLKPEYITNRDETKDVHLWYANAFEHQQRQFKQYPMCHVGMNIGTWRKLFRVSDSKSIVDSAQETLDADIGKHKDHDVFYNEKYFAKILAKWEGYPHRCQFINRKQLRPEFPADRLDRSDWDLSKLDSAIDAHLPRPAINYRDSILPAMKKVLTEEQLAWANDYWDRMVV